jgi:hypothetical protein
MTELANGAINVYVQKDREGPKQGFKINPKRTLKAMFDKFMADYSKEDKIRLFLFLNSRVLESETAEEVRMENGACIECLNFLNFWV